MHLQKTSQATGLKNIERFTFLYEHCKHLGKKMWQLCCHVRSQLNMWKIGQVCYNIPLVEPTVRVPPSDMKSTDVKGDSAVITFTDLNINNETIQDNTRHVNLNLDMLEDCY